MMTMTSSLPGSSPYFADFHLGSWSGNFVDIPSVNHFGTFMVYVFQTADSRIFPFPPVHAVLMPSVAWSKLSNNIKVSQQQFEKKDIYKYQDLN